jgi:3D (Asp-Asp-Asp) domain-containing protein
MKRSMIAVGLVFLLGPTVLAREQSLLARVTVYWASGGGGSDRWSRQHICSTGARLRAGHCAVDPRRIPYGSKVTLPDGTLLAVDTGSAVVSRKAARRAGRTPFERSALVIDRFFETKRQALSWANAHPLFMSVRVLTPEPRRTTAQGVPKRS